MLVIDTSLSTQPGSGFQLIREPIEDRRNAIESQLVMRPTLQAVIDLGRHFGLTVEPLPPRFTDYAGAADFQDGRRQAMLCFPKAGGPSKSNAV